MADKLLGKEVSAALNAKISEKVTRLETLGFHPALQIIRVGDGGGDLTYERNAVNRCEKLGINVEKVVLPEDIAQEKLLQVIRQANQNENLHGVLLLRPLPSHLDAEEIENALDPDKDVDGMTNTSLAGVFKGEPLGFPPCTAQACLEILDYYGIECCGKKAVVVGRSLVVGRPVAMMLMQRNATVTICHTKTHEISSVTREADLLIAAAGKANTISTEYIKPGAVVLDVGINMDDAGRICGDVDYESAEKVAKAITPVPGGIGSVTTSVLADHVVDAAAKKAGL